MTLLTTQRIICNGLAQLRFEEVWPTLSRRAGPTRALARGPLQPQAPRAARARRARSWSRRGARWSSSASGGACCGWPSWAVRDVLREDGVRAAFFTGDEGQKRADAEPRRLPRRPDARRCCSPRDAGGVGLNLQRAASAASTSSCPGTRRCSSSASAASIGSVRAARSTSTTSSASTGIESRIADLVGDKKALFTGLFDGTSDEVAFERSGTFLSRIERIVAPALEPAPAARGRGHRRLGGRFRRARDRRHRGRGRRVARRARADPARAGVAVCRARRAEALCGPDRAAKRARGPRDRGSARDRVDPGRSLCRAWLSSPGRGPGVPRADGRVAVRPR